MVFRVRSGFLGDDSCIDSVAVKKSRARGKKLDTRVESGSSQSQDDQRELLEEMGVNILSDNSNSCDSLAVPSFQVRGLYLTRRMLTPCVVLRF